MRPTGDRRADIRVEVVGALWGGLDIGDESRVVNIGKGGALVLARIPAAVGSTRTVVLRVDGNDIQVVARVRHLAEVPGISPWPFYEMGLEFIEAPAAFLNAFD